MGSRVSCRAAFSPKPAGFCVSLSERTTPSTSQGALFLPPLPVEPPDEDLSSRLGVSCSLMDLGVVPDLSAGDSCGAAGAPSSVRFLRGVVPTAARAPLIGFDFPLCWSDPVCSTASERLARVLGAAVALEVPAGNPA